MKFMPADQKCAHTGEGQCNKPPKPKNKIRIGKRTHYYCDTHYPQVSRDMNCPNTGWLNPTKTNQKPQKEWKKEWDQDNALRRLFLNRQNLAAWADKNNYETENKAVLKRHRREELRNTVKGWRT